MIVRHTGITLALVLGVLLATSALAQKRNNPRAGLLVLVDHAAATEEAARTCEHRLPGSGAPIRAAHAQWQVQQGVAQQALLQAFRNDMLARGGARGESPATAASGADTALLQFRAASLDKLRQSMAAMDADQLTRFCTDYPGQFATPEMDFTHLLLSRPSTP
jgi:hypothetical protein